jgi:amino acid adenylation domain-containing protein
MQQAMLFQYQLGPGSGLYIQQVLCSLHEDLNVPAFRWAWNQVLMRHPALRTSFRWRGSSEPVQDVHAQAHLFFEEQDWRAREPAWQESQLARFLKRDRKQGFDLAQAPLLRLALFRLAEADYKLVVTYHHIIADGWARYLVINEVFAWYGAYCTGQDLKLERPRPYRDHIERLRQMGRLESEIYWRQLLKGFTAPTAVDLIPMTDDSHAREGHGERETRLSEVLTSRLESVAERHQATLNTMVQGAWALLLSRYAGEDDIVFGAVRACRRSTVEGAGSIVGLFLNTLPVRVSISPDQSLAAWLGELREQHIAVRDHEQSALSQVVGWSEVPRGTPLFESIVVFDRARLTTRLRERGGSWLSREFQVIEDPAFALVLHAYGEAELLLRILYDRQRFEDATVERMLGHLKTLLEGMVIGSDRPLANLPMLTAEETHQLLVEWNQTRVDYPQDRMIHELFEAQVERTPDAIAVSFEGEHLTYEVLNRRCNQVAHHLQELGVGPETLVGVYMERSLEMVMALYGILKAGGAYLPLEPEYPVERLAFMLEDAQARVLLTQERLAGHLPTHSAAVVCVDSAWKNLDQGSADNPESGALPEHAAYVIFTSGSTGKPKGVVNTHRGILNRLLWMQDRYQLTEADRVLQKTPFGFDVSVWEFFWPLLVGARLVVARPGGHRDGTYLVKLIAEQGITTLHFVPSMLRLFLEEGDLQRCTSLKRVMCSGEALSYDLQELFFERLAAELHNLYGPTEAAVDVSHWQCRRDGDSRRIVPIGRPVANTQLHILDRCGQPVPIGVAGELHIGGIQVARGYLHRPELTAERFIPDPFCCSPDARLYRTGDRARYWPDGNIEFLGRLDFQVKLRGFRIELGEIEAVLNQHAAVRDSVVVAREDVPGDKRLVAYVVPVAAGAVRPRALWEFLRSKLPDYMVPAAFVELQAVPRLASGKVDRQSLPAPEWTGQVERTHVPPSNELEAAIASIWQELLQVDKVGLDDSFFELGGHSLLVVQAHHRLTEITDMELSITDLFRYPTIRALTHHLGQEPDAGGQIWVQRAPDRAQARRAAMARRWQQRQKIRMEIADGRS